MKILVTVNIPAISKQFDILVPDTMRVKNIIPLIANTAEELSDRLYVSSGNEVLCSVEKNIRLRPNTTLELYGIQNGDHLAMI